MRFCRHQHHTRSSRSHPPGQTGGLPGRRSSQHPFSSAGLLAIDMTVIRRLAKQARGTALVAIVALFALLPPLQNAQPSANPNYDIDPHAVFPSPESLLPTGVAYAD